MRCQLRVPWEGEAPSGIPGERGDTLGDFWIKGGGEEESGNAPIKKETDGCGLKGAAKEERETKWVCTEAGFIPFGGEGRENKGATLSEWLKT